MEQYSPINRIYEGYSKINLRLTGKNKPVVQRHSAFPVATSKV
jgi:hypothetical protein